MHVGKGRRNPLHVDYIFLGATLAYVQDSMFEAVLSHPRLELSTKIALIKALGKVLWIQNDLLSRWHSSDGLEYQNQEEGELDLATEPEGYLHGKRILGNSSSSGSENDSVSVTSSVSSGKTSLGRPIEDATHLASRGCPFSGMSFSDPSEQRAMATRSPRLEESPNLLMQFHKPGTPRVKVVDGKTVLKENLDPKPFDK